MSVIDWTAALKTAQEWLSKSIPAQLAIAVAAAVLLFGPEPLIAGMGLNAIRDAYRPWFGGALLFVGSLLSVELVWATGAWVRKRIAWRWNLHRLRRQLHVLTPPERAALRGYIDNNTRTQYFNPQDGVAQGLVHAKIIYRASSLGTLMGGFAYNIQPWAWDYLREHPQLSRVRPLHDTSRH